MPEDMVPPPDVAAANLERKSGKSININLFRVKNLETSKAQFHGLKPGETKDSAAYRAAPPRYAATSAHSRVACNDVNVASASSASSRARCDLGRCGSRARARPKAALARSCSPGEKRS
jgi:hypothetical protein